VRIEVEAALAQEKWMLLAIDCFVLQEWEMGNGQNEPWLRS
jgi:hypothetical protein